MRVLGLTLSPEDGNPDTITVEMTRAEAILIAEMVGGLPHSEAIAQGHKSETVSSIWHALVGSVFNRWWDNGVAGAKRGDTD